MDEAGKALGGGDGERRLGGGWAAALGRCGSRAPPASLLRSDRRVIEGWKKEAMQNAWQAGKGRTSQLAIWQAAGGGGGGGKGGDRAPPDRKTRPTQLT